MWRVLIHACALCPNLIWPVAVRKVWSKSVYGSSIETQQLSILVKVGLYIAPVGMHWGKLWRLPLWTFLTNGARTSYSFQELGPAGAAPADSEYERRVMSVCSRVLDEVETLTRKFTPVSYMASSCIIGQGWGGSGSSLVCPGLGTLQGGGDFGGGRVPSPPSGRPPSPRVFLA